ncbi:microtubule associated protein-domain-containing protein [Schizophyllum amplum]|uniref:Microtubule associated protein-domain-containing protein n=1 Tax=Schizophyllum amplum TaxID=97359 RepID=A0A550C2K1_9AGAR|nr:microtubule associated protein-domain-containing protein [Auriculariopsis ampla]
MAPPPNLTSLLNSLHSHLQTQTTLLPTLHNQLGLPSNALEDELSRLQTQLLAQVEELVHSRQKEVEEWAQRCEQVEDACIRYSRALGGNVKATGASVGELRKEKVLPKRYEAVTEHQEKLRQLYHTKLEQLTTLTNRITNLARILGFHFYSPDITSPAPAPGEDGSNPDANRDVSPERFAKLEKELVRGKGEVSKRLSQLAGIFAQIDWLYTELGMSPPALEDLSMSSRNSTLLSSDSPHSDTFLVSTPTPHSRTSRATTPLLMPDSDEKEYQRVFANYIARLEEVEEECLPESVTLENVEPTPGLLEWAAGLQASLDDLKRRRETHIQAMYDQLEGLWRRLGVDEADMDAFVEAHRGSTTETVREYEEELERMLELKRERMSTFILSAREEIVRLCDEIMISEEERADFAPFFDDEHTEELLTLHEDEIRRLREERRMKAPLLASIKKYFDICEEEKELAAAATDQTRLLGRGARDPGRLLREEKMRRRVAKEKPRLEQDLLASIPVWEDEAGRPFLVHGESIMQILSASASVADQENKRKGQRPGAVPRAGSVPARATTPVNGSGYVPGTRTGVVTPAVRPGSSMGGAHSVPNKRQRTEATPSYSGKRPPLGAHRGTNALSSSQRSHSPTKITVTGGKVSMSSLPRPVPSMVVPKPGTQHHALGHGRIPSTVVLSQSSGFGRSLSTSTSSYASSAYAAKKVSRVRRESFKPRPSSDGAPLMDGRWTFRAGSAVKEEEEDY